MRILISLLCVSTILLSTLSFANSPCKEKREPYLIELTLPSLVEYWKSLNKENDTREIILLYKEKLIRIHNKIKNWIRSRIGEVEIEDSFNAFNGLKVDLPPRIVPLVEKLPFIKRVISDAKVETLLKDSLPLIGLDKVWEIKNLTGKNVTVAVIDTGIDYNHPDLRNCYVGGYDFVGNDNDPYDDNGHGTHICGIIAGNGSASDGTYRGIAPNVKLYVYKALNSGGEGSESDIIQAINKAIDPNGDGDFSDHVDILSLSLGMADLGNEGDPDGPLSVAVDNAVDVGVTVIVAAGNSGWDKTIDTPMKHTILSPACARKAIAVGAVTHLDNSFPSGGPDHVALYSSKGPSLLLTVKPDIVAPGGDINFYLEEGMGGENPDKYNHSIVSTKSSICQHGKVINEYYVKLGGTSMAAPHVTGVVALLLEEHPDWDPFEIRAALRYTAKDLGYPMTYQGFGRIDAYKLLDLTSPPPVAIFFDAKEEVNRIILRGVAKARDFTSYQIFCKYIGPFNPDEFDKDGDWSLIYSSNNEVDEGILYEWNTSNFKEGWYLVKLVVRDSRHRYSEDYMIVKVENLDYFISVPSQVYEGEEFHVKIMDEKGTPVRAVVIMTSLFRLPRIRIGDDVIFRAYEIRNDKIGWIRVGIWVIIPDNGRLSLERKEVIVFNR